MPRMQLELQTRSTPLRLPPGIVQPTRRRRTSCRLRGQNSIRQKISRQQNSIFRAVQLRERRIPINLSKIEWTFNTPPPLDRFDQNSNLYRSGFNLQSELREMVRILFRLYLPSDSRQASPSFPPSPVVTSGLALQCCRKNAISSMCFVFRVEPLR